MRLSPLCAAFGVAGLAAALFVSHASAQEAAPASDPDATKSAAADDDSILGLILQSGASGVGFMVVLGLFSLVGATVAIERAFNTRRSRIVPSGFAADVQSLVRSRDAGIEEYRQVASRTSSPASRILRAGLMRCGRPIPEVEKSMEDAAAREMADLRGGIRPLTIVGNIAPLVGLLGTVLGMIVAFRTASQAGLGKGELMAQGIYLALLTTAAGLMIAIPALVLAAFFGSKVDKLFREIDEILMETIPWFARQEQSDQAESPVSREETLLEPAVLAARG